ncbi:MAG: response regulator transcription factor [Cellulosilyticum sp.]|nr:response regulator transcription factor [Cellulosilyticum sp.]
MGYKCLVIDDDIDIAKTTSEYFNIFDIKTAYATSYEDGLEFVQNNEVSLVLLDINLGENSGFELCKMIRQQSDVPIFFISARTSDDDVLTALNVGGDDYIKKPYTLNILLAKVKAVLKRYEKQQVVQQSQVEGNGDSVAEQSGVEINREPRTLQDNVMVQVTKQLVIDYNYRQIIKGGQPIKLKDMEFRLLCYLVENRNRVIKKDELFTKVWNDNFVGEGTLTVHIRHLREKIEDAPNQPKYIKTVWGIGYVFEVLE